MSGIGLSWGDSFGDAWGDSFGIGLSEEESPSVDLLVTARPPNVDFILQPRQWSHEHLRFRDTLHARSVVNMAGLRAAKRERAELKEMIGLYQNWRRAA